MDLGNLPTHPRSGQSPVLRNGLTFGGAMQGVEGLLPEVVDSLSSYDKNDKGLAPREKRVATFRDRVKRSRQKMEKEGVPVRHTRPDLEGDPMEEGDDDGHRDNSGGAASFKIGVNGSMHIPVGDMRRAARDDRLLSDSVSSTVRSYTLNSVYQLNRRRLPQRTVEEDEAGIPVVPPDQDDDDDDGPDADPNILDVDEPTGGPGLPRFGPVAPLGQMAMSTDTHHVTTFEEKAAGLDAEKQFEATMRGLIGPDQDHFANIDPDEKVFAYVDKTRNRALHTMQITEYAINTGRPIPKLPILPKSDVREALAAPDYAKSERPCVLGNKCSSYKESARRIKKDPKRYKGKEPFICKELILSPLRERVEECLASGINPNCVLPPKLFMCIHCNLECVTRFYNNFANGLSTVPVHIIHNFQNIVNVKGEYPVGKTLVGDKQFRGVIAPVLRHCWDNYGWNPAAPGVPERWYELECMDFQ